MWKYAAIAVLCASCAPTATREPTAAKEHVQDAPVETRPELSNTEPTPERSSISASAFGQRVKEAVGQSFGLFKSTAVPTLNNFWNRDFREYELHSVTQGLIDQIDDEEMLAFLKSRGLELTPEEILTSDNLIAYLQHKQLGTEAAYAWLDLTKGNPDFVKAVLDWQAIRQKRGFEFVPTYYLLFHAKLTTQKDAEVWSDLFRATFAALHERDSDRKVLMLMCLLGRLPRDLKEIDPPAVERIAFLAEELQQPEIEKPYRQMVLVALYQASFGAKRYTEAATWARGIEPPATGLSLTFAAQVLAKDIDAATATLSQIENLTPEDQQALAWCRDVIRQVKGTQPKAGSNEASQKTP